MGQGEGWIKQNKKVDQSISQSVRQSTKWSPPSPWQPAHRQLPDQPQEGWAQFHSAFLSPDPLRSAEPQPAHGDVAAHTRPQHLPTCVKNIKYTSAVPHMWHWIYKFTHASTTHAGPLHLPVCVKNIKSTSTFPHLWPIQGPYICRCVWKILNLQVHSHNVAHTGPHICRCT